MFKTKIINPKSLIIALLASSFIILASGGVLAQKQTIGVSVTPSIAYIDLSNEPGEYILTYTNNYNSDITLNLSAKDFTELENSYKLEFLEKNRAENYKYSLSSWITFENPTLNLSPKETKTIKIFIDSKRITKGGHYASILAEIIQPDIQKDISIKAILSSLLFVRASTGREIEEGKISLFKKSSEGIESPNSFLLRFLNSGNVYVIPYGLVQIYNPFGKIVGKGILNEDSLVSLPESIRNYKIPVKTDTILLPGIYTAKLNIHFGKTNQKLEYSIKFFSQGSFDLIKTGFGVILIAIILLLYKKRRKNKTLPSS